MNFRIFYVGVYHIILFHFKLSCVYSISIGVARTDTRVSVSENTHSSGTADFVADFVVVITIKVKERMTIVSCFIQFDVLAAVVIWTVKFEFGFANAGMLLQKNLKQKTRPKFYIFDDKKLSSFYEISMMCL